MVWYTVTLFFVILWGGRLRRQVLQPQVRRAYLGVIITLCCWILFREIKLSLPDFMNDGIRYIWYSYYLFYGILISFLLWIGYSASYAFLTRPCPRWMKGIFAGNLLLAFLVISTSWSLRCLLVWRRLTAVMAMGPCISSWLLSMAWSFWL